MVRAQEMQLVTRALHTAEILSLQVGGDLEGTGPHPCSSNLLLGWCPHYQ